MTKLRPMLSDFYLQSKVISVAGTIAELFDIVNSLCNRKQTTSTGYNRIKDVKVTKVFNRLVVKFLQAFLYILLLPLLLV